MLQVILGVYFVSIGVTHFVLPGGLPEPMSWMHELSSGLHYFSRAAELWAGLALILPGLFRIQIRLTPLAGAGLVPLMIGAMLWHIPRDEIANILFCLVGAAFSGFVAYGRWRIRPLKARRRVSPEAGTDFVSTYSRP